MRKLTILISLAFFAMSAVNAQTPAQAEEVNPEAEMWVKPKAILGLSPFHFFDNTFYVSAEKLHENDQGTLLNVGFTLRDDQNYKRIGTQLELQHRFYLSGNTWNPYLKESFFRGVYFAPYVKLRDLTVTDYVDVYNPQINEMETVEDAERYGNVGGGVLIGLRLLYGSRFFVDVYAGGGIQYAFNRGDDEYMKNLFQPGYTGVSPHGGIQLGFSF